MTTEPDTDSAAQPYVEDGPTTKQAWWAGYRAGKGLPPDTPRQAALAAPPAQPAAQSAPQPEIAEIIRKIDKADAVVHALCVGTQRWTMSVPARPDEDPDLVIHDALSAARSVLARSRAPTGDAK
jgi:hypothetical protein